MVINLSKLKELKCTQCGNGLIVERKLSINFGHCMDCGKVWMLNYSKDGKNIVKYECYNLNFFIEFNVELPFNLGLPTGIYSFDVPNQIRLRRDMYYFQKGNELENIQTMQPYYYPERETFNEFGIVRKDHQDKSYKTKMKTVLFKKFRVSGTFRKDIEINVILNEPNMLKLIFKTQIQFLKLINEFLMYYCIFFPINNLNNLLQHEVKPISTYEFSKCLFNCRVIIDNKPYEIIPIIQDYTNLKGYPDISYLNENGKLDEFEKLLQNRKSIPIPEYHQMFVLARSLYRTNRNYMGATIITMGMTAYEALLHDLEATHPHFQDLKNVRENLFRTHRALLKYPRRSNNYFGFLEFYTAYAQKSLRWLLRRTYKIDTETLKEVRKSLMELNKMRWIRNDIVHEAKFSKQVETTDDSHKGLKEKYVITFINKKTGRIDTIEFNQLWHSFLRVYDILNKILLKAKFTTIDWDVRSSFKLEDLGYNAEPGKFILPMIPNINWREMTVYNEKFEPPAVPPELFPLDLVTNDDKKICISLSKDIENIERMSHIEFPINSSLEETKNLLLSKSGFISLIKNSPRMYESCENCGYILPIHQHHIYKNFVCPKCNTNFDIIQKWLKSGLNYFETQDFNAAIEFFKKVLEVDPKNLDAINNIAGSYHYIGNNEKALELFDKIDLDLIKDSNKKITFLCHKAMCYYDLNQKEQYKEILDKAFIIDAENLYILFIQCIYLMKEGKLDNALNLCEDLIKKDITNSEFIYLKSLILARKNDKLGTLKCLSRAFELNPSLKARAKEQEEFLKFNDSDEFKKILDS